MKESPHHWERGDNSSFRVKFISVFWRNWLKSDSDPHQLRERHRFQVLLNVTLSVLTFIDDNQEKHTAQEEMNLDSLVTNPNNGLYVWTIMLQFEKWSDINTTWHQQ